MILALAGPSTSPEYLPLWVAAAEGHFDRQGLKVTVRTTRSEVGAAEALAQGQADLAATSLEALMRFGTREGQSPRLLLGLTAAPPVALVASTAHAPRVREIGHLAGAHIAMAAPGAPENAWLNLLLARARLTPVQVHIISVGATGLERALTNGDVHAAVLGDPGAARLVAERRVTVLADLRTPAAAQRALGAATVSAGVFVRADRRPGERELAAFTNAVLAAEQRLATGLVGDLATKLPPHVVGSAEEFVARVTQAKTVYLPDGRVTADQLENTMQLLRDQLPLPSRARIQLLPQGRVKTTPGR